MSQRRSVIGCLSGVVGSAANAGFIQGRSDLNFAIVLQRITQEDLEALHSLLPAWHRLGVATPLVVDLDFLAHARDVFPIELEEIRANHRILAGEDVLSSLRIDRTHLRRQLEQEGRAKLLRLRVQYAETGGERRAVEALMLDSVTSFLVIIRAVLRLQVDSIPAASTEVLNRFEAITGERLSGIRQVSNARAGGARPSPAAAVFREYLGDVERLIGVIDRLSVNAAADHTGSE
jgi:hypothetical protein